MKKLIVVILFPILIFISLSYHGVFRNNNNPLDVTKYFFECIKSNEWFLTYQVFDRKKFNAGLIRGLYAEYNVSLVDKIDLDLGETKNANASVKAKLNYKGKKTRYLIVDLEKSGNIWLVSGIKNI